MQTGHDDILGIPGGEPPEPRRPWLTSLELVVAIGLMVFFALAVLGFLLDLTSGKHVSSGVSRPAQVVVAAVCVGLVVLCGRWAQRIEHRIRHRRGEPAALTFTGQPVVSTAGATAGTNHAETAAHQTQVSRRRTRTRQRHYGPGSAIVIVVLFTAVVIGATAWTFALRADGERSSFVQKHGIPAAGVVTHVNNIQDCGRYSCSYHAKINVRLTPPVRGAVSTVVNYPEFSDLIEGEQVQILVDPRELGYAEFEGEPSVGSWNWIGVAVVALIALLLDVLAIRGLMELLRHRRAHRDAGGPALAGSGLGGS